MSVERYLQIELAPGSPAVQDLYERLKRESSQPAISLTGDGDPGSLSGHLTPAMSGWLLDHVSRPRQSALAAAEGAAARIKLDGGVEGICEPIEYDRLKRKRNERCHEETKTFYERYGERLGKLAELERDYKKLRVEEGGRDAQVPPRLAVYGVPLLIMLPEFFMNYVSFVKLAGVPAVGFGLAMVVAAAVAITSFMTGTFWKAYHYYMPSDNRAQRSKGLRRIGIATVVLAISLCAVAYARYHMVLEQVQAAVILGLPPPNIAAQTAGLLAGNLLVFAIGAAVTYLMHDENPEFARKAEDYRALRGEVEALRQKQLTAKLEAIEQSHKQNVTKLHQKARLMDGEPDYLPVGDMISSIEAKDAEVVGALTNYRMRLADQIILGNPDFRFTGPVTDRYAARNGAMISPSEFTSLPLHLYRSN